MIPFPLVEIVWHDAVSSDQWQAIEDAPQDFAEIHTVGYLIHQCESSMTVAMNLDLSEEQLSMTMTIPIAWIDSKQFTILS